MENLIAHNGNQKWLSIGREYYYNIKNYSCIEVTVELGQINVTGLKIPKDVGQLN